MVAKGNAQIVDDNEEKMDALNAPMQKYQSKENMNHLILHVVHPTSEFNQDNPTSNAR